MDVTVVIPVYNRSKHITRALQSISAQHRLPKEVIVVDDCSTDGTADVVRNWARNQNVKIRLEIMSRNSGPAAARNRGIALSITRYVAFMDSDDEYLPNALERLTYPLTHIPNAVLSFSDALVLTPTSREPHGLLAPRIDLDRDSEPVENGSPILRLRDPISKLLNASFIPTCATCFLRSAALLVGGMPSEFRSGEDWLFWLRLAQQGEFVFQAEDFVVVNRHEDNLTHPRSSAFVAGEKLRGFAALKDNQVGVALDERQQARIGVLYEKQLKTWRYQSSRLGLPSYMKTLKGFAKTTNTSVVAHLLGDSKSALRALAFSAFSSRINVADGPTVETSAIVGPTAQSGSAYETNQPQQLASFKAKVALAALRGDQTLPMLAKHFNVHPIEITQWKTELVRRSAEVFTPVEQATRGLTK